VARTSAGAVLSVQHRQAQLALRATVLRDFMRLWPVWDGGEWTFRLLVDATIPLVRERHRTSNGLAALYYEQFRSVERPRDAAVSPRLAVLDEAALAGGMYVTGRDMTRRALVAGMSPQAAMQTALTRVSGTVGRLALAGGRDTLVQTAEADPRAQGYGRVLSPGSCDFCQGLAGRVVTDDFQAHDHCGCSAEPAF
jgi:hypothetical protein